MEQIQWLAVKWCLKYGTWCPRPCEGEGLNRHKPPRECVTVLICFYHLHPLFHVSCVFGCCWSICVACKADAQCSMPFDSTLLGEASNDNAFPMLAPASSGLHWWREQSQAVTDVTAPNRNPWFDSCKKKSLDDPFQRFLVHFGILLPFRLFISFFSIPQEHAVRKTSPTSQVSPSYCWDDRVEGGPFSWLRLRQGFVAVPCRRCNQGTKRWARDACVLFVASISFQHLSNSFIFVSVPLLLFQGVDHF